jgi:hypothetical protein
MIPRREGRDTGSGGGGRALWGAATPFFCKVCGRTVSRTQVMEGVDVCKRCRVKPPRSKMQGNKR